MANQQHIDLIKQGVEVWNKWIDEHIDIIPDFSKANLMDADLRGAYLKNADFRGANLKDAYLDEAYLFGANLSRVNLKDAELTSANLTEANLSRARLIDANLNGTILTGANLSHANLSGALLVGAYLNQANLSHADLSGALLIGADLNGALLLAADLTGAELTRAFLNETDLTLAYLEGANLTKAVLVKANLMDATLTNCKVYGIAAWDIELEGTEQSNLIITDKGQPTITVDNLEIAQFIYLLLEYKKLRDALNSVIDRGVLLLGRFRDGGLELLKAIAAQLREMQYLPMIFDFDRQDGRNLIETTMTLVGLSRFVIVDLSGPSVPYELGRLVPNFRLPFVPIIEEGRKGQIFSIFPELLENDWVLPLIAFSSQENLMELLPSRIIEPAEKMCEERQARLHQLFNN